jgi:hypothetical protein
MSAVLFPPLTTSYRAAIKFEAGLPLPVSLPAVLQWRGDEAENAELSTLLAKKVTQLLLRERLIKAKIPFPPNTFRLKTFKIY